MELLLQDLPRNLKTMYTRILQKKWTSPGGPSKLAKARRIFEWLATARRPLTIDELCEAIAIDKDDNERKTAAMARDATKLLDTCGNLAFLDSNDQTVRFAHHTILQFLFAGKDFAAASGLTPSEQEAVEAVSLDHDTLELEVGERCLAYLCFADFERQITIKRPELRFDASNAANRINQVIPGGRHIQTMTRFLRPKSDRKSTPVSKVAIPYTNSASVGANVEDGYPMWKYIKSHWFLHIASVSPSTGKSWKNLERIVYHLNFPDDDVRPWTKLTPTRSSITGESEVADGIDDFHNRLTRRETDPEDLRHAIIGYLECWQRQGLEKSFIWSIQHDNPPIFVMTCPKELKTLRDVPDQLVNFDPLKPPIRGIVHLITMDLQRLIWLIAIATWHYESLQIATTLWMWAYKWRPVDKDDFRSILWGMCDSLQNPSFFNSLFLNLAERDDTCSQQLLKFIIDRTWLGPSLFLGAFDAMAESFTALADKMVRFGHQSAVDVLCIICSATTSEAATVYPEWIICYALNVLESAFRGFEFEHPEEDILSCSTKFGRELTYGTGSEALVHYLLSFAEGATDHAGSTDALWIAVMDSCNELPFVLGSPICSTEILYTALLEKMRIANLTAGDMLGGEPILIRLARRGLTNAIGALWDAEVSGWSQKVVRLHMTGSQRQKAPSRGTSVYEIASTRFVADKWRAVRSSNGQNVWDAAASFGNIYAFGTLIDIISHGRLLGEWVDQDDEELLEEVGSTFLRAFGFEYSHVGTVHLPQALREWLIQRQLKVASP